MSYKQETIEEVLKYPVKAIPERGITKETCRHFRVRSAVNTEDGKTVEAAYFPYTHNGELAGFKKIDFTKAKSEKGRFSYVGPKGDVGQHCDLFGQLRAETGGKKVFTTEGEFDTLALWQVLKNKSPDYNPSVVAIGGTSWTKAQVGNNQDFYSKFQENIFVMDNDKCTPEELKKGQRKGYEATLDIIGLMPKALVTEFSEKDSNDMLLEGKEDELYWAVMAKAHQFQPEGFIKVDDVFDEATKMPEWGKSWPWPSLTKATYGRRLGEGIYIGAGVKVGKSECLNEIAHHITQVEKGGIALFKLEEKPAMTIRKMAGKIKGKPFHKPDADFLQEELIDGVTLVRASGAVFYDSYGSTSWEKLKAAIRHAVVVEGVEDVAIDPLTRLTTGMDSGDANTELEKISDELSAMAKDLGFFYMIFCHLKAPAQGKPHEEGGKVKSNQFTGSRAMMRCAYYFLGIERDKTKEDEDERNTSYFVLLEDRAFGNSCRFPVFFNKETGEYKEPKHDNF